MTEATTFTQWIINHGVSQTVLELLISVCIVSTIVSIARYVLGSKTYGIYAPIILAIAYSYTGLKYGLAITFVVVLISLLSYSILKKIRMHYISRIAADYTILSMGLVLFFILVDTFGLGLENMANIPPLAFICIATLSDFFIRQYIKKSIKISILTLLGTIFAAIAGWFVITRDIISQYVLNNLWIIPLLTIVNILLGTFKGLRVKELFRFKFTAREDER